MRSLTHAYHKALRCAETGQDLVDYALLVAMIAVVVAGALAVLGGELTGLLDSSVHRIAEAVGLGL